MVQYSKGRTEAALLALVCAVMLALAGCGGEDEPAAGGGGTKASPEVAAKVKAAAPLSGTGEAGESYVPKGKIVADSGFRPDVDGFSFENYTNEDEPQNLTPANVEALFGEQVCVAGTGEECLLTPAGEKWMETQNEIMDGGHCMGFSVASLRMFAETLDPNAFGAEIPNELEFENPDLQATIAESFVYQSIPNIPITPGKPNEILDSLIKYINEGKDYYTLGFFDANGENGHAVTPLAVEDKGGGKFAILIYDNNHPNLVNAVEIDRNTNTFRYTGSTNPEEGAFVYEGDQMDLAPTLVGEEQQPCPFCNGELVEEGEEETLGSVLPEDKQYAEVALVGDNENHPHLIFTDTEDETKQTGIIDGELVNDIEGVDVVQQYTDDPSLGAPEPKYRLPLDQDVAITVDGTDLEKTAKGVAINYTAKGKVVEIEDITIAPGQQDTMLVTAESYTIVYETNNEKGDAPSFFAGVDDKDASYTLGATVVGAGPGSLIAMAILEKDGQVLFDLADAKPTDGDEVTAILAISKLDDEGENLWINEGVAIDTSAKEDLYLNYKEQELTPGEPIDIEIGPEDGPFRTEAAEYDE